MQSISYKGKRVLVIGLGLSGRSAAKFLINKQALVHGVDRNLTALQEQADVLALKQAGMTVQADQEDVDVQSFDLVVLSPGIPSTHPLVAQAAKKGIEVIGEIELGCRFTCRLLLCIV